MAKERLVISSNSPALTPAAMVCAQDAAFRAAAQDCSQARKLPVDAVFGRARMLEVGRAPAQSIHL